MTDQPINPLLAGKGTSGYKVTAADLEGVAATLNESAAEHNCPWRFTVAPNPAKAGRMSLLKVDYTPPPSLEAQRDVMDRRGERMSSADTALLNAKLEHYGASPRPEVVFAA